MQTASLPLNVLPVPRCLLKPCLPQLTCLVFFPSQNKLLGFRSPALPCAAKTADQSFLCLNVTPLL